MTTKDLLFPMGNGVYYSEKHDQFVLVEDDNTTGPQSILFAIQMVNDSPFGWAMSDLSFTFIGDL